MALVRSRFDAFGGAERFVQSAIAALSAQGATLTLVTRRWPDNDGTAIILDRPRHENLVRQVREAGARIKFITDGDVAGAVLAARGGADILLGTGGAPEAVVAACALRCIGGAMQCRLWPRDDNDRKLAVERGLDVTRVLAIDDLVSSDDVFFAASGITTGDLLKGVEYVAGGATSESLVMRARSGTIRRIQTEHHWRKLEQISGTRYTN